MQRLERQRSRWLGWRSWANTLGLTRVISSGLSSIEGAKNGKMEASKGIAVMSESTPKRRWYHLMRRAERQRRAVQAIRKAGGQVCYDYEFDFLVKPKPPGPAWLRRLVGIDFFANVVHVYLDTEVDDEDLEHLNGLPKLDTLSLGGTQVTDGGLAQLKLLGDLQHLALVCNPHVGDRGLGHLRGLKKLKTLVLSSTQITVEGLRHLKGLSNLNELFVFDAEVTEKGINELRKALPECEIHWSPKPPPKTNPKTNLDQP